MKLPVVEKKLHLYVWDQFAPEWKYGLAFAIAENEDAGVKVYEYVKSDELFQEETELIQSVTLAGLMSS